MTLVDLFESINLQIRLSDYTNPPENPILVFKSELTKSKFIEFIANIESTLDSTPILSIETISAFAKELVNKQWFIDGNHRTALALCFYLCIMHNHQLPRIQTYLLYASIDFEYAKNIFGLSPKIPFFSNNAIQTALLSRSISNIYSPKLQIKYFEQNIKDILGLAKFLTDLKKTASLPRSAGKTTQIQLFKQFAGFRHEFCHSSYLTIQSYSSALKIDNLLDEAFNPKPAPKRPL